MFVRNAWYVAALASEIGEKPFARTILGEPVVLYRKADGGPVALYDQCCHRQAPLSLGEVEGDRIRCNYHGLLYEPDGTCAHVPGQTKVPPGARVPSFPAVERYRWIWLWMGDPAKADDSLIPDYHWAEDPDWYALGEHIHMDGNYQLLVDNLLDLSHLAYTHRRTIGVPDVAEKADTKHDVDGDKVVIRRETLDHPLPPGLSQAYQYEKNVDRRQTIRFVAPSGVIIESAIKPTESGTQPASAPNGWTQMILNAITPETDRTLHYFWVNARNFRKDPEADGITLERIRLTFAEDTDMIEGQQARYDREPDPPRIDINADAGALAARRIVARMIEAEKLNPAAE